MDKNADDTNKCDGRKDLGNLPFITTGSMDFETETERIHIDSCDPKDLAELGRLLGRFPMHDTTVVDGDLEIQALVLDHPPQAESRQTSSAPAQNAQH